MVQITLIKHFGVVETEWRPQYNHALFNNYPLNNPADVTLFCVFQRHKKLRGFKTMTILLCVILNMTLVVLFLPHCTLISTTAAQIGSIGTIV